jgi:amidohydrolase
VDLAAISPAEPFAAAKARLAASVEEVRDEILALSHAIHADPEPAFEEHRAATRVADAIARRGFAVELPAGRLATAVRGRLAGGRGGTGPRIGILAEYDALPILGHGCGHNTMAASGVGAAVALAALAPELCGEIVFLGTPAEERGSGKQLMIDDGLFAGLDAAILFHPGDLTEVEARLLASEDVDVTFIGRASHAASEPWEGRNAVDALVLLFTSVGLWRQQLKPDARVHGIILEGGSAANIIPDRGIARFMFRSSDQAYFDGMRERFRALVDAAAMASGCEAEITFSGGSDTMRHNRTLGDRFAANLAAYGIVDDPASDRLGSSDMGNVSRVCPTIHPTIAICPEGVPGHSIEFRDAAVSPRADEVTVIAATVVAQTAYELFADRDLVAAAWGEFNGA